MVDHKDQVRSDERLRVPCKPYALVVDDNPVILLHVADILDAKGFCTFAVAHADHALDCLGEYSGRIALLLTDIEMPGRLDGLALAHFVRERWPRTAIVVSSAYVVPATDEMPNGSVFLARPFSPDEVAKAVEAALAHISA